MPSRDTSPRIILTLEPIRDPSGWDREPSYRLRVALKRMLRAEGLRCVDIHETPQRAAESEEGRHHA